MSEIKEIKRKKEDFRIEIRKSKQDKTFSANRQKLIQRLFEEEDNSSEKLGFMSQSPFHNQQNNSSTNNIKPFFGISQFESNQTSSGNQNSNLLAVKVDKVYTIQEITELLGQFLEYLNNSGPSLTSSISSSSLQQISQFPQENQQLLDMQIAQNILREILVPLLTFEDLFKQISDKNCYLFEQAQVHIHLFKYLQAILQQYQAALSLDLQGAEALLSKVFQYLVNVCLNSDKALDDCFNLHIINYFINVMISSNFYTQQSKMILFSVNLLDHVASRNRQDYIKMLTEQEITRQILTLMRDVKESILKQQQGANNSTANTFDNQQQQQTDQNNNNENIEGFYRKLLVHLSSILSNISRHKEMMDQGDNSLLIDTCQQLIMIICKEINERNKQNQNLKKFYSTLPQLQQQQQQNKENFEEEDLEEDEVGTNDTFSKGKKSPSNTSSSIFRTSEEQRIYEELVTIENNLSSSLLNIIELMEAEDVDVYISENICFLVFAESQIVGLEEQTAENSTRIQFYGELMNGLLMGDDDQIEIVIETFQILDYIRNMLYSPYQNLVITGLSCLFNILISASSSQFDLIYEHDKNIVCRLLHLINNYSNNVQLQSESINTLSAFIDKADKSVLDFTLRPTNIMNVIIQKLDPCNDSSIIRATLSLLESLLKSEEYYGNNDEDDEDIEEEGQEEEEDDDDDHDNNNDDEMNDNEDGEEVKEKEKKKTNNTFKTLSCQKPDNYWALKFQSNPAGNHQITKLFNSCHSKEIILQLDSILDEYME